MAGINKYWGLVCDESAYRRRSQGLSRHLYQTIRMRRLSRMISRS